MRNVGRATKIGGLMIAAALAGGCQTQQPSELNTARADLAADNFSGASMAADAYLAKDSNSAQAAYAYYIKGRALERTPAQSEDEKSQNLQAARYAYINALKAGPADRKLEGMIRAGIGNVAFWQDDYATAVEQDTAAYGMVEDAYTRSWALYRAGLSQQRLGEFESADRTLGMVVKYFPGSEPAARAQSRIGTRDFNVQLVFSQPQIATEAASKLSRMGFPINRIPAMGGRSNVLIGPFNSYTAAKSAKSRIASEYSMATIVP